MPRPNPVGPVAGVLCLAFAGAAAGQNCNSWSALSGNPWPPLQTDKGAAFDGLRAVVVVFGGYQSGIPGVYDGAVATFDGTTWVAGPVGPPRRAPSFAYDAARQNCVMFGGATGTTTASGETWTLTASGWTLRASTGPSARGFSPMAYDSARQVCVIFGGESNAGRFGDTWEWNGTAWAQRASTGPSARSNHALAYDPVRARTVLYGGWPVSGLDSNETWEWDGSVWSLRAASGLGMANVGMCYDPILGGVVRAGGSNGTTQFADASLWNGTSWAPITALPQPRSRHDLVHDPLRARTYALAGNAVPLGASLAVVHPAAITQQPVGAAVVPGQPAAFSVTASSTSPITYQWRHDGQDIPGATGATYSIPQATVADQGSYDVLVTTGCNPLYSNPAVLTVQCAPQITQQPVSVSAAPGAVAAFGVTVANAAPSYQWRKDGSPIAGATAAFYWLLVQGAQDQAQYDVVVTTPCGPVTSTAAVLTVAQPCYPNCDNSTVSPILNVLDFNCFLSRFAQGCP